MKMKAGTLTVLLLLCGVLSLSAQQMSVSDFARLKRPLWKRSKVTVDKKMALLDLYTTEKGFAFVADGKTPAEAEEGEGVITLKLPHKTQFVTIKHPDYGQLMWRVPAKRLKKKKHYRATLDAYDPTKTYKLQQQWVVFDLLPRSVILTVDSTTTCLRDTGRVQRYLPVGRHSYRVEAPFYEAVEDTFLLTDTAKLVIPVRLQPFYSYLTVKVPWPGASCYVDHEPISETTYTSQRLAPGRHHVALFWGPDCYYEGMVHVARAEKKVLTLTMNDLYPRRLKREDRVAAEPMAADSMATRKQQLAETARNDSVVRYAPVTLKADDDSTEIWVDREPKGLGQWQGQLAQGFHLVNTRKGGQESLASYIWVEGEFPQELSLPVPQTSRGMLNVHSNVVGAMVLLDGQPVGLTPCVLQDLDASRRYEVSLVMAGYKRAKTKVQPKRNDLVDVFVKLKKK